MDLAVGVSQFANHLHAVQALQVVIGNDQVDKRFLPRMDHAVDQLDCGCAPYNRRQLHAPGSGTPVQRREDVAIF